MAFSPRHRTYIGFKPTGDLGDFTIFTSRTKGTVWYLKAPPTKPPTVRQLHYRNRFRAAAATWNQLPQDQRNAWNLACRRAHLYLSGYALWLYWQLTRNRPQIRTIERQSGVALL